MKAISKVLGALLTCVISYCLLIVFLASFLFSWGYTLQDAKYYSDPNRFIELTAVCNGISIGETCYLFVDDMHYDDPYGRVFNNGFRIGGKNSDIVRAAGIEEKLIPGTTVTFISSPDCYSNGYQYPIVALEVDGEILLDFDTGYSNLMNKYWWVKTKAKN